MRCLFETKSVAYDFVMRTLIKAYDGKIFFQKHERNKSRHLFLKSNKEGIPNYYVVFKRQFIQTFNLMCPSLINEDPDYYKGVGESINEECLSFAARNNCVILFVYENKSIYSLHPSIIYKFFNKATPRVKGEMLRTQRRANNYRLRDGSGTSQRTYELTFVFPIIWLERVFL